MTSWHINDLHLDAEVMLKKLLIEFFTKSPEVTFKNYPVSLSQNFDTLSTHTVASVDFQPLSAFDTETIVVYCTPWHEVGYGVFSNTLRTILTMDVFSLIMQLIPHETGTPLQIRRLYVVVENMHRLVTT